MLKKRRWQRLMKKVKVFIGQIEPIIVEGKDIEVSDDTSCRLIVKEKENGKTIAFFKTWNYWSLVE
jgi:hypothetical protein